MCADGVKAGMGGGVAGVGVYVWVLTCAEFWASGLLGAEWPGRLVPMLLLLTTTLLVLLSCVCTHLIMCGDIPPDLWGF